MEKSDNCYEDFHQFRTPCSVILSGRSGAGKSFLMKQILENRENLCKTLPDRIIWCYSVDQPDFFKTLPPEVELHYGLPDFDSLGIEKKPSRKSKNRKKYSTFLVLDDFQENIDLEMSRLFTAYSHKRNLTIFLLLQNFFDKNQYVRNCSVNTHILIIFPNYRDMSQFNHIAGQISPRNRDDLIQVYDEVAKTPYNYLLIDTTILCPKELRWRSDILNEVDGCAVWRCEEEENGGEMQENQEKVVVGGSSNGGGGGGGKKRKRKEQLLPEYSPRQKRAKTVSP